jgi:hypothetical protein
MSILTSQKNRISHYLYYFLGNWINTGRTRFQVDYRPDSHYVFDRYPQFNESFETWLAGNQYNNCGDLSRFYTLWLNVNQVLRDGVAGDFVELGVYKGNSAGLLAKFAREHQRQVYLFDTFEGFDQRDLKETEKKMTGLFSDTSVEAVQTLIGTDSITFVKGFFPDSAAQITMPEKIAIAHIDCDLYAPMKAGLEWFYPLLSKGGMMILHDYSSGHWDGITQAIDEFFRDLPEKPVLVPDKSGTVIIRKSN